MISVALATCNGAAFLDEQLQSLATQRRLPDELVVADDASDDASVAIVEHFAARAPFPLRIHRQAARVGVARNFTTALELCAGSLIATCDQDDRWHPDRLALAEAAFADPQVLVCCSDAELTDATGAPLGRRLFASAGITPDQLAQLSGPDPLAAVLARRFVTGTTMTLRRELVQAALPIGEGWIHDEWLVAQAALRGGRIAVLPAALVEYRQHGANAVGAATDGLWPRARRALTGLRGAGRSRAARQLAQWKSLAAATTADPAVPATKREQLNARIRHLEYRATLPDSAVARTGRVLRALAAGQYRSDSMGAWSALQDLVG